MATANPKLNHTLHCDEWLNLLDELNIGAFAVGSNRRIDAINYSAQALMGLKASEVIGEDCREVFTGVPCMVNCKLRNHGNHATTEPDVEITDDDDSKLLLTRLATPIYDAGGQVAGCLTILQDHSPIADLIDRIHYEERSLKIILNNLDVGIFTVNRGGYITFFNNEAEKISGYDRRTVLGKPCSAIFGSEAAHDLCLLKESIADGSARSSRPGKMMTTEGETIPVRANYLALKNEKGAVVGGLATFHDLTLVRQLTRAMRDRYTFHDMIGKSPEMQKIFEMVNVVARTDATVLIEGATGTGKDLLAKVMHSSSRRSDHPFVKVNCAAIPDNLLESELFGYVRGAFSGADRDKPGRFDEADSGTIFLDEIGDLPISLQAKLLRVLEDKEFYPLGSRHTRKVNVRIVSATNRGLDKLVTEQQFREDLFYRLNVFRIELPEIKDRREDLPLLISHILRRVGATRGNSRVELSEEALEVLLNYDYPGNVRELENVLEHALIICTHDIIQHTHLPDYIHTRLASLPTYRSPAVTLAPDEEHTDRQQIIACLQQHHGNRNKAARALGINRTTLWRKMKRYGLS
ncbi:MAG: PAS domain-containing protein [Desulfobacterales bacterium]|nr:PAS domain-containing protein [Desulfobacterales bacterium]